MGFDSYKEYIEHLETELEKSRKKAKKWKKKYKKLKNSLAIKEESAFPYDAFTFDYEVRPTVPDSYRDCWVCRQ